MTANKRVLIHSFKLNFNIKNYLPAELDKEAWYQLKYADCFDEFKQFKDNTERISVNEVSKQEFIERYEKPYKPVVITDITNTWKAVDKWTLPVSSCVQEELRF